MARLTDEAPQEILARRGYRVASQVGGTPAAPVAPGVSDPIPERDAGKESLVADPDEEGGSARIVVRITRCGSRIIDADNLAGAKALIDQMRYARLIPDDNPQAIRLELCQRKVKRKDIGTIIEITPIP